MQALGLAHPPGELGPIPSWVSDLVADLRGASPDEAAAPLADLAFSDPGVGLSDLADHEARTGADLARVRVHAGPKATAACEALGAKAFTRGEHIAVRDASPSSETLEHELGHVLQGRAGEVPVSGLSRPGDTVERGASEPGDAVTETSPDGQVMREEDDGVDWDAGFAAGLEVVTDTLLGAVPLLGPALLAGDTALETLDVEQVVGAIDHVWPVDATLSATADVALGLGGPYVEGGSTQAVTNQGDGRFHVARSVEVTAGVLGAAAPSLKSKLEAVVADVEAEAGVWAKVGVPVSLEIVQAVHVEQVGDLATLVALASQHATSVLPAVLEHLGEAELVSIRVSAGVEGAGEAAVEGELDALIPDLVGQLLDTLFEGSSERLGELTGKLAEVAASVGVEVPVELVAPQDDSDPWRVRASCVASGSVSAELLAALTQLDGVPELAAGVDGEVQLLLEWTLEPDETYVSAVELVACGAGHGSGLGMVWNIDPGRDEQGDSDSGLTDVLPTLLVVRAVTGLDRALGSAFVGGVDDFFGVEGSNLSSDWDGFGGRAEGQLELELGFRTEAMLLLLEAVRGLADAEPPGPDELLEVLRVASAGELAASLAEETLAALGTLFELRKAAGWVEATAGLGATTRASAGGPATAVLGLAARLGARQSWNWAESEHAGSARDVAEEHLGTILGGES